MCLKHNVVKHFQGCFVANPWNTLNIARQSRSKEIALAWTDGAITNKLLFSKLFDKLFGAPPCLCSYLLALKSLDNRLLGFFSFLIFLSTCIFLLLCLVYLTVKLWPSPLLCGPRKLRPFLFLPTIGFF